MFYSRMSLNIEHEELLLYVKAAYVVLSNWSHLK